MEVVRTDTVSPAPITRRRRCCNRPDRPGPRLSNRVRRRSRPRVSPSVATLPRALRSLVTSRLRLNFGPARRRRFRHIGIDVFADILAGTHGDSAVIIAGDIEIVHGPGRGAGRPARRRRAPLRVPIAEAAATAWNGLMLLRSRPKTNCDRTPRPGAIPEQLFEADFRFGHATFDDDPDLGACFSGLGPGLQEQERREIALKLGISLVQHEPLAQDGRAGRGSGRTGRSARSGPCCRSAAATRPVRHRGHDHARRCATGGRGP